MTTLHTAAASRTDPRPTAVTPVRPSGGSRSTLRLARHLVPYWRRLLPAALAAAGSELAAAALMATASWLITRAAQQPLIASVSLAIVAVRALALGRGALRYVDRLLGHDGVLRAVAGFRTRVYEALVPLAPAGTPAFRSGDLLTRLVDDVDAAQDLLLRVLLPAVAAGAVCVAATTTAALLLPQAGLLLGLLLAAAALLVPAAVLAVAHRAGREQAAVRAELAAHVVDLTQGAADLAAYGARDRAAERARRAASRIARLERHRALTTSLASAVLLLLQGTALVAVTWTALHAHADGRLPSVHLTVLAVLALVSFEALEALPAAAFRLAEVRARAARLADLFDTPPPVTEPAAPAALTADGPIGVRITNLTVRHSTDAPPALDGVSLHLSAGRCTVLLGASGSGKSTLIAALMRFVDYESGSIRLAGHELRDCAGSDVRRVITGMTQDAHVFHATIRANLLLARPGATDAELRDAARRARILDWIESLPKGFDTFIGQDGTEVSGGQRSRLLLARALLADPPVLVLDEPTEGLDPDTASAVLADILDATRGRTTLLVAHEREGLTAADQVVRLDGGRILARGAA
ncbi:thiol reductant ABC exporter subunit CydC [Streptomyces sp. CoH27]|uniref:thiol reductant ABC exporter subunit CydC n=1 Tax=Streptomyces sp. CoH27 TaxID=2875763 RepID=UPI001CD238AF|nr:thiol reductant ABC exporter subunit CydC [Streptomyces sp. CoH27]